MHVERLLPDDQGAELVELVHEIATTELAPRAASAEEAGEFPRWALSLLGRTGVLSMPYAERWGGADQPYETYLQALEEIAGAWLTVAVGVSVHVMTCFPMVRFGTDAQQRAYLPTMLDGTTLGAYALSEPQAGSDITSMITRAKRGADGYDLSGAKAWITHAGHADFYTVFARTSEARTGGLSCFQVPGDAAGLSAGSPERKMGLTASPTAALYLDAVTVGDDRRIGAEGDGMRIALTALDRGRLGIAACATGLAQAALDCATAYAAQRVQFGRTIGDFQGCQFLLADMAAAVDAARATYLVAARKLDRGMEFTRDAAVAKLAASDAAMRVTTDAVQVLGGAGYTRDHPAERYLREAKVTQIFEGTNQIQRIVIGRELLRAVS